MNNWKEEFEEKWEYAVESNGFRVLGSVDPYLIKQFISELLQENVEHCGEPECPECNKTAYNAGYKAGREDCVKKVEDYFRGLIHIPSPEKTKKKLKKKG